MEKIALPSGSTTAGHLRGTKCYVEISKLTNFRPGGISMVPVWVTLPEDVPARESFELILIGLALEIL